MREPMLTAALLLLCAASAPAEPIRLSFIDHYNLRYVYQSDEAGLRSQVAEIKRNLDRAKHYGAETYILFSRSFEFLVNYDFSIDGLGDLRNVVWPADSDHRTLQQLYAQCLNEVLDYAKARGIRVIFHTNQFDFPPKLYEMAGDRMSGSARVCPGKPLAYQVVTAKLREFFTRFPKCAGLQITLSETQVKLSECKCDSCRDLTNAQRFVRVIQAANDACAPLGKELLTRTWGGIGDRESIESLPPGVICSTKHTSGDFHLASGPSTIIGESADRQEVEFDGWGEYFGYNHFPCYLGDVFAERIRTCAQRGVKRVAIRLNWNGTSNHIFDRPFGNEANIHVLAGLAADPTPDPDDLLRDYITLVYPEGARNAAFRLYKASAGLQTVWMTWLGRNANDHSRVYTRFGGGTILGRVESQIGEALPATYEEVHRITDKRRLQLDAAYREAVLLVDALGPEAPEDWKRELRRGARAEWFVAQGVCDCAQLFAAERERRRTGRLPDLGSLAEGAVSRARLWETTDPESYALLEGGGAVTLLEEVRLNSK